MIIGTAFGKIVSSLVGDVIMPVLGALLNTVDFTKLSYAIPSLSGPEVFVNYGKFLQTVFDFLIIALAIFVFISAMNKAIKKPASKPSAPAADIVLLTEIRDALVASKKKPERLISSEKKSPKKSKS